MSTVNAKKRNEAITGTQVYPEYYTPNKAELQYQILFTMQILKLASPSKPSVKPGSVHFILNKQTVI